MMTREKMIKVIYEKVWWFEDRDWNKFCMIGDVLDWYFKNKRKTHEPCQSIWILHDFKLKRKPIEAQSIECITFIYDLCC